MIFFFLISKVVKILVKRKVLIKSGNYKVWRGISLNNKIIEKKLAFLSNTCATSLWILGTKKLSKQKNFEEQQCCPKSILPRLNFQYPDHEWTKWLSHYLLQEQRDRNWVKLNSKLGCISFYLFEQNGLIPLCPPKLWTITHFSP